MKVILIAFHFFMVLCYLVMGGILIFTNVLTIIEGTTRVLLGIVLIFYGSYRGFSIYKNIISKNN